MHSDKTGRVRVLAQAMRPLAALVVLLMAPALSACTTAEGTNALVDPATFEREVMTSTLQGLDIVPQDNVKPTNVRRAPLVLPKQTAQLPVPTAPDTAALPKNSDSPKINTAGLTDADLQRLRNARVVDLRSLDGRPLTAVEQRQLTARMQAANMRVATSTADRPLYLPPPEYFSSYKGKDLICLAKDGVLVAINDPKCPEKIRSVLQKQRRAPDAQSVDAGITQDLNNASAPVKNN